MKNKHTGNNRATTGRSSRAAAQRSRSAPRPLTRKSAGLDLSLRPRSLAEFVGQERLKKILGMSIEAARQRGEVLDHVLFSGTARAWARPRSRISSRASWASILRSTSGPAIERAGDLAAIVDDLDEGDVLFIDEIHRLARRGRRDPLSRDGGLRAQYRGRQGAGRALDEARGQAVHAGRRDHALGAAELAAARSVRPAFPSRFLQTRRADRNRAPLGAAARSARSTTTAPTRWRRARAARRASPIGCCAACAISRRSTRPRS